eukprot:Phypoly_transcript_22392.p1 GENE.Phypoly_transcript_22392~~Phypoly_transcript_22392.p1  ORF type:complete len:198 (-),score=26.28 Phypoly_transcript_22392:20-586(-)
MEYIVKLNVYDVTQGMVKQMSKAFVGQQIDGIWHSSLVVYGKEYNFLGQISNTPLEGRYGPPIEVITLGTTTKTQRMFEEFLDTLHGRYMETYHLLDSNCNHFSNDCSQFLVDKGIPPHINGIPEGVLDTPFGQTILKPMIEQFFSAQNWKPISDQNPIQENPLFAAVLDMFEELRQDYSMFGFSRPT